jgi:hypothetical protein
VALDSRCGSRSTCLSHFEVLFDARRVRKEAHPLHVFEHAGMQKLQPEKLMNSGLYHTEARASVEGALAHV